MPFLPFKSSLPLPTLLCNGNLNETALLDESVTSPFFLSFFPLSQIFDIEKLSFLLLPIPAPSLVLPLTTSSALAESKLANLKSLLDSQSHSDIAIL
ncbi:hypothetical protein MtrunA17_Chr4g0073151 [Medicago truncatula]|uniref:Uncharacterized protein n=1 Tax=Medicago truncatula TaxID=3880 RepID=A0A396IIX1_MEDTR|nr:hypothetical protein MtrunA17_Chr4g0073151 [Medicago truncatula]